MVIVLWLLYSYTQTKTRLDTDSVTETTALLKVESRIEVQKYKMDLSGLGSKAEIVVEDLGDDWNVHVFEVVGDGDSSHTATFGWYRVNKKTGEVIKDI